MEYWQKPTDGRAIRDAVSYDFAATLLISQAYYLVEV